jgi:hypothetical protein
MSWLSGGGPIGSLGALSGAQGKAKDARKILMQMQRQQALRYTQAQGAQLQGLDALRGGFDEAIQNVGRTGLASKLGVESAGKQARSSVQQRLASSGIQGTTLGAQVPGAYQGQTAAALAGIDQSVAAAKGNLLATKGSALNQAYGGLSGLFQNWSGSESELMQMLAQLRLDTPSNFDEGLRMAGSLADIFGSAYGSGGGGGG